jgi:hypothetical protein
VQPGTDRYRAIRIDGAVTLLHVLNFSLFIDDYGRALRPLVFAALHIVGLQNLVGRQHFLIHVAEERKGNTDLLRECGVGGGTVDADSEDDGIVCFKFGQISLIGL